MIESLAEINALNRATFKTADAWSESQHKRASNGEFTSKGGKNDVGIHVIERTNTLKRAESKHHKWVVKNPKATWAQKRAMFQQILAEEKNVEKERIKAKQAK